MQLKKRVHSLAKMLNGTNSWIAFDTSAYVGGVYYKYYLMESIQAPVSLPITAVRHIGWATIDGNYRRISNTRNILIQRERVFIDLHNRVYSPKAGNYLTILQSGIMIDPTLTHKMNLNHELMEGFPCLPTATPNNRFKIINGEPGLKALGRYIC